MNIYQKLLEVRKSVDYFKKANSGNQYPYVSSSQVLGTLRNKINEVGLILVPRITNHNLTSDLISKQDNYGEKHTITYFTELDMTFTWVNTEKPDEQIECTWYGQGVDIAGEKGVGKALTYAEKYFMLKFFNIPTDKDDPDSFQEKLEDKPQKSEQKPKQQYVQQQKQKQEPQPKAEPKQEPKGEIILCEDCGAKISEKVANFSKTKYGKKLCMTCQK